MFITLSFITLPASFHITIALNDTLSTTCQIPIGHLNHVKIVVIVVGAEVGIASLILM